jgi:integrase
MRQRDLAPGTIKSRLWYVRGVFRTALRDRVISHDPTAGVDTPPVPRRSSRMAIPTAEQVGALMASTDRDFAVYIALCAFGGLRLGEAAAVQVGDLDFLGRSLHVQRQVQRRQGGQVDVRGPKKDSVRTVHLPDDVMAELSQLFARRELTGADDQTFIFAQPDGQPPHQNTVGHRWRKARTAAGVGDLRLHDLRHFYASGLIHAGCDVVTVQNALGHSKASITLDTYSHLWPKAEDRTRAAAAGLWAAATRASGGTFPEALR